MNKALQKKIQSLEAENRDLRTKNSNQKVKSRPESKYSPTTKAPKPPQSAKAKPLRIITSPPHRRVISNAPIGKTNNRVLTLKQLKDTIQDIYT